MAIFDPNTLRAEEKLGNFQVGDKEEEFFSMNNEEEYPGMLPDFDFEENPMSDFIGQREGIDLSIKNKKVDLTNAVSVQPVIDISPLPTSNDTSQPEGESFFKERPQEDEQQDLGSSRISYALNNTKTGGGSAYNVSNSEFQNNNNDEFDLTSALNEGLNIRDNKKKAKLETYDDFYASFDEEPTNSHFSDSQHPANLDEENFDVVYDFDDIKASSPSKLGLADLEEATTENKEEENNKKKKRILPLWAIISLSAVATIVIVGILGLVAYKIYLKKTENPQKNDSTLVSNQKQEYFNKPKIAKHSELIAENEDVKVKLNVEVKPNFIKETTNNSQAQTKNIQATEHIDTVNTTVSKNATITKTSQPQDIKDVKIEVAKKNMANATKEVVKLNTVDKTTRARLEPKKQASGKSKSNTISTTQPTISNTPNAKIIENETFFVPKQEQKKQVAKNTTITAKPNAPNIEEVQEYSIQVYSTLSKSDAEQMLQKIQNMGVKNPFITAQQVRDEVWYRVRFGSFPNKNEAKLFASKFGFSQIWIDRVK